MFLSLLAFICYFLLSSCFLLFCLFLYERSKLKALIVTRNKSIMEDLDLATSDQLLDELRKRPGFPYVMISPVVNEDYDGISIEIHNIPPLASVKMLDLGSNLMNQEFKKHGIKLFENQSTVDLDEDEEDEDEEWKG